MRIMSMPPIENFIYKGQCEHCESKFPNEKTRVRSRVAMRAWVRRHQEKTNHTVRTAITHVRKYEGKGR